MRLPIQKEAFHVLHRRQVAIPGTRRDPDPLFARALQQAIGGVEGEIRVAMQYFFRACGARGNPKCVSAWDIGPDSILMMFGIQFALFSLEKQRHGDPISTF